MNFRLISHSGIVFNGVVFRGTVVVVVVVVVVVFSSSSLSALSLSALSSRALSLSVSSLLMLSLSILSLSVSYSAVSPFLMTSLFSFCSASLEADVFVDDIFLKRRCAKYLSSPHSRPLSVAVVTTVLSSKPS